MRLENANTQAEFETKRINQFYEVGLLPFS